MYKQLPLFVFIIVLSTQLSAQSARDKLLSKVETHTDEITRVVDEIKNEYEGSSSGTQQYVLHNIGFETDLDNVCKVAFLQKEAAEDGHRTRTLLFSLDAGDIDVSKKWMDPKAKGIITLPMRMETTVYAEAFVRGVKKKERNLEAFDIASPDDPKRLISSLKKLIGFCYGE